MDNAAVITTEAAVLPLDFFYTVLKENGFAVTPLQIINANRVVLQYAGWVKNEDDTYEVLDGQQRTISICEYVTGSFSLNSMYFHKDYPGKN